MYTTIQISDRPITVQYSFIGKEAQETRLTPRERPEMILERFFEGDKDVTEEIENNEDLELIEEQILNKI